MPDCDATFYRFTIHQKTLSNLQQSKKSLKKRELNWLKKNLRSTGSRHLSLKNQTDEDQADELFKFSELN